MLSDFNDLKVNEICDACKLHPIMNVATRKYATLDRHTPDMRLIEYLGYKSQGLKNLVIWLVILVKTQNKKMIESVYRWVTLSNSFSFFPTK